MSHLRGIAGRTAGLFVLLSAVAGCSSLGPDTAAAADVATSFHQAVQAGNGSAACADLAPDTAERLEFQAQAPCPEALLDEQLPDGGSVHSEQAFGHGAQVLMDSDTVFLTITDGRWTVRAAGCQARSGQPYQCRVKGG